MNSPSVQKHLQALLARSTEDPDGGDALLWTQVGIASAELGLKAEAEEAFVRALQKDGSAAGALRGLAAVHLVDGRVTSAEALFARWFRADPTGRPEAVAGVARCRQRRGDDAGAMAVIHDFATERGLTDDLAAVFVESATRLGHAEDAVSIAAPIASATSHPPLLHAFGDALDRLGRHEEAFGAWSRANSARGLRFSPADDRRSLDEHLRHWSAEALARAPRAPTDPRPVFIVGVPRSGTSLLEQVLGMHPDVHPRGELDLVPKLSLHLPRRLGRNPAEPWLGALDQATLDEVASVALEELTGPAGSARRVIDKLPRNLRQAGLISVVFPGARILRCTRDPLDISLSVFRTHLGEAHPWAVTPEGIRAWIEGCERLSDHWRGAGVEVLDVAYEDVVSSPEETLRLVLAQLDLPWDPAVLDHASSDRVVATASYAQATRPIHSKSVGRAEPYRHYLTRP